MSLYKYIPCLAITIISNMVQYLPCTTPVTDLLKLAGLRTCYDFQLHRERLWFGLYWRQIDWRWEYSQLPNTTYTKHTSSLQNPSVKVKWSLYRPGVAQRVGRGIALLFHDRGQQHAPAALWPRKRPSTHFTWGWVDSRAGLEGRKISSPTGFDLGPSSP